MYFNNRFLRKPTAVTDLELRDQVKTLITVLLSLLSISALQSASLQVGTEFLL